jgi:protein-disulfide isomerase
MLSALLPVMMMQPVFAADAASLQPGGASEPAMVLPERAMGKADAPIKVDEYVSLTCPHCAEFYNSILPILDERYIKTGKARFVFHDYVMDRAGLDGAMLARCMPAEQFFPFIKILYANQSSWVLGTDPIKMLVSYARLGGLPEDKAQACLKDTKLQNAIVAEEAAVQDKVEATPTFIINDGVQTISGVQPPDVFAAAFNKILAEKNLK